MAGTPYVDYALTDMTVAEAKTVSGLSKRELGREKLARAGGSRAVSITLVVSPVARLRSAPRLLSQRARRDPPP